MLEPLCECMYCVRDIGVCEKDFYDPSEIYGPSLDTVIEDGTEPF